MNRKQMKISRRTFLMAGATAAAGCATKSPPAVPATEAMNIGLIGCGARGRALASQLAAKPGAPVRITAVSDACPGRREQMARLMQAVNCRCWHDVLERQDIDAVVVATPDHLHAPIAIAAMETGKDVYCERPIALSLEDAKKVRDTAECSRRILQIGAQQTSEAQWHLARRMVKSGDLGKIRWSQGRYRSADDAPTAPFDANDPPDWDAFFNGTRSGPDPDRFSNWRKYQDYSGGVAWSDLYWKLAALLVALPAEWPTRVAAAGGIYTADGREVPDSFVLNAEFPSGHTIVLASAMAGNRDWPAVIRGAEAAIEFNGDTVNVIADSGYGESRSVAVEPRPDHIDNWLAGIRSRRKCVCDEALGYQTAAIIAMAMEAFRTQTTIAYDPDSETFSQAPSRV